MQESMIDRIQQLERSKRFWKTTALILGAALLSVLGCGVTIVAVTQQRAAREMADVARQEMAARAQAEEARRQAEQALHEAKQRNEKK